MHILYEDDHMLAVFKNFGTVSVPAETIPEAKTLQGQVRQWAEQEGKDYKPYLLNRLDKDSSGIVLMGKFPRDREKLEALFQDPRTEKIYLALVKGHPKKVHGTINRPVEARTRDIKVPAVTHYRLEQRFDQASLLEVKIETGRKHQIRKHLAFIGHPLLMDPMYGDKPFNHQYKRRFPKAHMVLHAAEVRFIHPFTGKKVVIQADLP